MCGIVGFTGQQPAAEIVLSGLHKLEYRGYDSAGIALDAGAGEPLAILRRAGQIHKLEQALFASGNALPLSATCGIGHTRWATHGPPTEPNAHPHLSQNGKFAIVHNGIIENYAPLKQMLIAKGYNFRSDTDSEVIAHLIEDAYKGNFEEAIASMLEQVQGTYGIVAMSSLHPGTLIAVRKGSPIVVGVCKNQTIIASDVSAIVGHTDQVIFLDDDDVLVATPDQFRITAGKAGVVSRPATTVDWEAGAIEKGGFEHFMLKEISEQPDAIANTLRGRLIEEEGTAKLAGLQMTARELAGIDRFCIAACGTSFYAGLVGKLYFEAFADIPVDVQQAAEFRDRNPIIQRNTCMIAISQSGETADTLAALREAARKGALTLGLCNVVGSTIAREAGRGVYLHAGPEIGVASTKAFSCQVTVLALMAILLGRNRRLGREEGRNMVKQLAALPDICQQVIAASDSIRRVAERFAEMKSCFYIGRGYMYPVALEGALKLKEISYIHAEGYHAAELKHGPIALLEKAVPVVALAPDTPGVEKTLSNIQECRARSAPVLAVVTAGSQHAHDCADERIEIPPCPAFLAPIPATIAMQLLAYHIADLRGCPIDKPRNLAKSVTVE
jgi:glutamine---fructose-6-phosphate transaminase (isomerizing)